MLFCFIGKVDVSLTDSVQQLISLFRSLCITFGKPYSDKKVRIDDKQTHFGASLQTNERVLFSPSWTISLKENSDEFLYNL